MFYVLDQNYLRDEELRQLKKNKNCKFVIPDVALLEMCKSDEWQETMRRSLEILSDCKNRVFFSESVGYGIFNEIESGVSIEGKILFPLQRQKELRIIFDNLNEGIDRIMPNIHNAQMDARQSALNGDLNKRMFINRIEFFKLNSEDRLFSALRNGTLERAVLYNEIIRISLKECFLFLTKNGLSKTKAKALISKKPLILRLFYIAVYNCAAWIETGGFVSMRPEKATNERQDLDYVLVGSFFEKLLSKDKRVQTADAVLREIIRMANSSFLRAYKEAGNFGQ